MTHIYTIRQECPPDYDEVYDLVNQAFAATVHSDGTEADYLNDVRKKDTFIPELSLVAEDETGKIVGQIVLYQTFITTENEEIKALVLSPISVHPNFFGKGIARMMIDHAIHRAFDMDFIAVFLCGEPEVYQRLGFIPSYEFDIFHKDDPKAQWCMGRELVPGSLKDINGTIDIV